MPYTVAVIGVNGILGKPVLDALLSEPFASKISFPVKVISSSGKTPVESDKFEVIKSQNNYAELLKGVDVVVNLMGVPACASSELIDALVENKVKLYLPSQFGTDLPASHAILPNFLALKNDHSIAARAKGIKTVDVVNGLFIDSNQLFLGSPFSVLDFDKDTTTVEIIDNDNTLINPTFIEDVGKTVAALITRDDFSEIPDLVRVYSGRVTLGDLVAHYEKTHGVKVNKKYTKSEDIIAKAQEMYKNFSFNDFLFYLKTLIAAGEGKGVIYEKENHREFVNPGESLFKWTKYTI